MDFSTSALLTPEELVLKMADGKGRDVAGQFPEALVIAADTIVVLEQRVLGKPRDEKDAAEILSSLSGRWHQVYTGLALYHQAKERTAAAVETTKVHFRELSLKEIEFYIKSGEPMDKAGAYGIQGLGAVLVQGIEGCFFNVMGLPLFRLACLLKDFGVDVLEVNAFVRSLHQESPL